MRVCGIRDVFSYIVGGTKYLRWIHANTSSRKGYAIQIRGPSSGGRNRPSNMVPSIVSQRGGTNIVGVCGITLPHIEAWYAVYEAS